MSEEIPSLVDAQGVIMYPSYAVLRATHTQLLRRHREQAFTPQLQNDIIVFLQQASATGALLQEEEIRLAVQSLLDYWATLLYRMGYDAPNILLHEFDPALAPNLDDAAVPYQGLDSFQEANTNVFFGRQRLVEQMLQGLADCRLQAVVGPSGSGKSSLVRAGLLPALKAGALSGSETWRILPTILPGSNPLDALATAFAPFAVSNDNEHSEISADSLRNDHTLLSRFATAHATPILLFVDQFEELFTLCHNPADQQAYINNLLALIETPETEHRIILTIRSDYETFVSRTPALEAWMKQGRVPITPLTAGELRDAIVQPAELVGLKFEPGVVEELLHELLGEPAALPLLQFTLLKLWENRTHNLVTHETYNRVGGGRKALAQSATAFYNAQIPEDQYVIRVILLRMVRLDNGLEVTSNRIRRDLLYQNNLAAVRVDWVIEKLLRARLVRLTPGNTPADDQIEVAHEALVRNWPDLVDWLEHERLSLRQSQIYEAQASEWARLGRGESSLLSDEQINEIQDWIKSGKSATVGLSETLAALLEASKMALREAQRKQELAEKREQELQTTRAVAKAEAQSNRVLRWFIGALALLLIFVVSALIYAESQRRIAFTASAQARQEASAAQTSEAKAQQSEQGLRASEAELRQQRDIGIGQRLILAAQNSMSSDPETALLLAYEAAARNSNESAGLELRDALEHMPFSVRSIAVSKQSVTHAVFSPDGQQILTADAEGNARIWSLTGQPIATLPGGKALLYYAVYSPDGRRIITADETATLRLWDVRGQLLATIQEQVGRNTGVAFSPDGNRIAAASSDSSALLLDTNGRVITRLVGHIGPITSIQFSHNGQYILTTGYDKTARVWSSDGKQEIVLEGHSDVVFSAAFSFDDTYILTVAADTTARLWTVDGTSVATLSGHNSGVVSAEFSPDDQQLITASNDTTARLLSQSGNLISILAGHSNQLVSARFSPNGKSILTASVDHTARLWTANGQLLAVLSGHREGLTSAVFSPDSQHIATTSSDGTLRIWTYRGPALPVLTGHTSPVYNVGFSPDGSSILTSSFDGTARLWNLAGQSLQMLSGHSGAIVDSEISPNGKFFLTASQDTTARLWDQQGRQLATFGGYSDTLTKAIFSPNGKLCLIASFDGTAHLWDLNGTQLALFSPNNGPITNIAFSPDSASLLTGNLDGSVQLWSTTGQSIAELKGHTAEVTSVSFSPNGAFILTTSEDKTARLWNSRGELIARLEAPDKIFHGAFSPDSAKFITTYENGIAQVWNTSGEVLFTLQGHLARVGRASFSPDGRFIVTTSYDKTARLWDSNGRLQAVLSGHTARVYRAEFSPDSRRIVTASADGTARQYFVETADIMDVAACRVGRMLSAEEITNYEIGTPHLDGERRSCQ